MQVPSLQGKDWKRRVCGIRVASAVVRGEEKEVVKVVTGGKIP